MFTIQQVRDALIALQNDVDAANARMDLIVTLVANLRTGSGASQAEVDEMKSRVDAISLVVADVLNKQNSVLA